MFEIPMHLPREERFRIFVEERIKAHMAEDPDFRARISGIEEIYQKLLFTSGLRFIVVPSRRQVANEALEETKKEAVSLGIPSAQIGGLVSGGRQIGRTFKLEEYHQQREASQSRI